MKIAIVGLGSMGRRHLKNLIALGERNIILYRNSMSTLPDKELEGLPVETNIDALLENTPSAVIISNPTALHLDVAIPCASAGCHILLEKPVSHSLERISDLQSAVKRGGGNVLVGFQFRFHPTLQTAAKIIADGEIGTVVSVHSHWGEYLPEWHPWEDYRKGYAARSDLGGGVVLTLCHPFDYLSWLLGRPELAWAHTATKGDLGIPVEDTAEVVLRFPGGAFGFVHLDYIQRPATHNLEIIGTRGTLRWNNDDGVLALYQDGRQNIFTPPEGFERNSMFLEEMHHFLSVARLETQSTCTLDDGISALEIALQILSFKGGKVKDV